MLYNECKYTYDNAEKIVSYKTWSKRQKIDTLFHIDCLFYCNLGIDSSVSERKIVRSRSRNLYRMIKGLDARLGDLLLGTMDVK